MNDRQRPVFQCQQCGECCRGRGGILVSQTEISKIAEFMGLSEANFQRRYVEPSPLGPHLATNKAGICIFNLEGRCRVHPVKPQICQDWPFLPAILADPEELELAKGACPGIAPDCSHAEFVKWWQENLASPESLTPGGKDSGEQSAKKSSKPLT
ncbi:MAG: YkgJ family cysteine cluster protein [Desulfobacteraceae bacterium]